jgi:hypothetical protein
MKRLFGDVESRAKQANALRELAACVERGEVYAVLTVVVGVGSLEGPTSEASEWFDANQAEVRDPEKRAMIRHIIDHHEVKARKARGS